MSAPDDRPFRVIVVDSIEGAYVDRPDVEQHVLAGLADVELVRVASERGLAGRLANVDAAISWHTIALGAETIRQMARCRGIVRAAVGYDNIDIAAARDLGIPVCNVPDYGTEEVADHTWALLLAVVRRLTAVDRGCREGAWDWRAIGSVRRLRGERLGIVGLGRIGTAVARRAPAFGMEVGFYDPHLPSGVDKALGIVRYETLQDLLAACGIVTVHVNLTDETRGLIGADELARMRPGAILINTSRGLVVDQQAMVDALIRGRLGALGLDVLDGEPHVPLELRCNDRVVLTAHSAFYSDEGLRELRVKAAEIARNLLLDQFDRNIVNDVRRPAVDRRATAFCMELQS